MSSRRRRRAIGATVRLGGRGGGVDSLIIVAASKTPKPTLVLFVRHGKTPTTGSVLPGRAPNLHLAEEGVKQAERAAERIGAIGKKRVAAVYASPMERTQETAAPIAAALGREVLTADGLIEADFGDWTGRKLSDLRKLKVWSQVQNYPSGFRFPNGESFAEMQTRMVVAHNHPSGMVVPSEADKALTQRLKSALALIDVRLIDHVIVGRGTHVSLRAKGLI